MKQRTRVLFAMMLAPALFLVATMWLQAQAPAKPAGEPPAATQLTDDEKKDLTILNQGMVIQQQRFNLLQVEITKTQQAYSLLAGERNQRLAKAKLDHKWDDSVVCNPDELVCVKAGPKAGEQQKSEVIQK